MRELRALKRLTTKSVANHLHVSQQTYTRYENGQRLPNIHVLESLSSLYKVPVLAFFVDMHKVATKQTHTLTELAALHDILFSEYRRITDKRMSLLKDHEKNALIEDYGKLPLYIERMDHLERQMKDLFVAKHRRIRDDQTILADCSYIYTQSMRMRRHSRPKQDENPD
jgi:transcriptional regulator with XRE-family HTH domain